MFKHFIILSEVTHDIGKKALNIFQECLPVLQTLSDAHHQDILQGTQRYHSLSLEESVQLLRKLLVTLERDCL